MGFLGLIGAWGGKGTVEEWQGLFCLVPKQAPIGYFRNLEQGHFAYLNGGDPLEHIRNVYSH